MFNIFTKWAEEGRKQAYEDGFAWACTEHLLRKVPISGVRDKIAMEFSTAFDTGAFDAINRLSAAASALDAANHNYKVIDAEVVQYRAEIGRYQSCIAKYQAIIHNQENEIDHYRTALASVQTKCKTVLHGLPLEFTDAYQGDSAAGFVQNDRAS